MIQTQTMLDIADNSGARRVMCIKVFGGSHRRYARVGDIIKVTIKEAHPRGRVKKGQVVRRSGADSKGVRRPDGSIIRFDDNAAVLLNTNLSPSVRVSLARSRGSCAARTLCASSRLRRKCSEGKAGMRKIKRNDEVVVLTGRDKGKRGDVLRVMDDGRALVSGVNIVKKHTRPESLWRTSPGGIKEKEAPIQLSNLAHLERRRRPR